MTQNVIIMVVIRHTWSGIKRTFVPSVKRQPYSVRNWRIVPVLFANSRLSGWHLDRLLENSLVVCQA